jgi:hypothetical protein
MVCVSERDVFQLPHMNGILQIRMKIEQHEQAVGRRISDVIQDFVRFQNGLLRLIAWIKRL